MSLSRTGLLDRKSTRRGVKKGHMFKENQVLISSETRSKPLKHRKNDRHVAVDLAEFQLLVKLYVPANLLIKNNKVSMKQLNAYLPELVSERYAELNFELHIFLSSLVTAYVLSWYCEKLNTEDFAFVCAIYETLCFYVTDVCRRILDIVALGRLLAMANGLAGILDLHIRDNSVENGVPRYALLIKERCASTLLENGVPALLKRTYLSENHILFDDSAEISGQKVSPSCQIYLRMLVKNILRTAFAGPNCKVQGPESSVVITNFLTVLIADLILINMVAKLSSPKFLISTVFGGTCASLSTNFKGKNAPGPELLPSLYLEKAKSCCWGIYRNLNSASVALRQYLRHPKQTPTVLYSPVISLVNSITNFSGRKPILASLLRLSRSIVFTIGTLGHQIDNFMASFLLDKFHQSAIVEDTTLAHIVESLRCSLFEKNNENSANQASPRNKSILEVSDEIFNLLQGQMKVSSPFGISLESFAFAGETESDMKANIEAFLRVFDLDQPGFTTDSLGEKSDMNLLLVMKILDCLVQNIYPEMTVDISGPWMENTGSTECRSGL